MAFENDTPEISYPCAWGYRVVAVSEDAVRELIVEVCKDAEHTVLSARPSRTGTYVSVHLEVVVQDEAHRLTVYRALAEADIVKVVL